MADKMGRVTYPLGVFWSPIDEPVYGKDAARRVVPWVALSLVWLASLIGDRRSWANSRATR